MTLVFTSATGALYNRLGKLGLLIKQAKTYQAAQFTNMTDTTNGVVAQYNAESDIQAQMGSNYIAVVNALTSVGSFCQGMARDTINRMVYRDTPRLGQTLQQVNILASIQEVILQMIAQGASVLAQTITATPQTGATPQTPFFGEGNGVILMSTKRALDGRVLENTFAESLQVLCTLDSYVGNATAGNEQMSITGTGSVGLFDFNWPGGSDGQLSLNVIDGNTDVGSGNLLTNSDFSEWTVNVPDNFTLTTGTAGVNIAEETGLIYDGTSALKIIGDGVTNTTLAQIFNDATGTTGTLSPLTQYGFNIFLRRDGTAPAAGILTIELVDQNLLQISDQNGVANAINIDLTALSTTYTAYNIAFRTPFIMPTTAYWRMRLSTPLTNGRSVYAAKAALGFTSQVYIGGPSIAIFAGSVPFASGDYAYITVANGRGSGGTLSTFQTLLYQLLPEVQQNEILFPSNASPSISDLLIG